jgi:hypothetical protein
MRGWSSFRCGLRMKRANTEGHRRTSTSLAARRRRTVRGSAINDTEDVHELLLRGRAQPGEHRAEVIANSALG